MADSEAKWYILHTYSGYEKKVAADILKVVENRNLQHLIEDVAVPIVTRQIEKENGKIDEVEEKVYPGYVFVKMAKTDESWYICRNTRGVTGFVGPEGKPTPMRESEVRDLEKHRVEKAAPLFSVGDKVVIKQGVLEGFEGVIAEIDSERNNAVVNVSSMFGEVTPTTIEIASIKKIED